MSSHKSENNPLYEPDASVEAFASPLQGNPTSLSLRRHKSNVPPQIDPLHSDDDTEISHYSPKSSGEESTIARTRSWGRADSITDGGAVPKGTQAVLLPRSATSLGESPGLQAPSPALDRPKSPLLHMLGHHSDLSPGLRDLDEPRQVHTARAPATTGQPLGKRMSEAISAPASAREPPSPMQRAITFSNDISMPGATSISSPPPPIINAIATPAGRRDTRPLAPHVPAAQSFLDYLGAELYPGPSYSTTDAVWGQTERDRVYNALMAVPFQLERLLWLGMAVCLDSFLAVFTVLPLRVIGAVGNVLLWMLRSVTGRQRKQPGGGIRGDHIYDLLCAVMFATVVIFLWKLKAGSIYYWVKDLTQEFLKLSVLLTALELSDKVNAKREERETCFFFGNCGCYCSAVCFNQLWGIQNELIKYIANQLIIFILFHFMLQICCSFLVDVLEALAASCTALASQPHFSFPRAFNVASDAAVALALLLAHGAALMAQALVFGVAMNSQKNTLLALLIASNFTEIKGTVLKRFDPTKLYVLACQDVVERFHLLVVLSFVLVEEMSGTGATVPSRKLLAQCSYVLMGEVVIDVIKHAVLGKFNEIRPGVYREFTKDLCEQVATAQSHTMHRLVGYEPFSPAALFFRVAMSYWALRGEHSGGYSPGRSAIAVICVWAVLAVVKIGLGFLLKRTAVAYLKRYEARRGRARVAQVRVRTVGFQGLGPGLAGGSPSPTKKEN